MGDQATEPTDGPADGADSSFSDYQQIMEFPENLIFEQASEHSYQDIYANDSSVAKIFDELQGGLREYIAQQKDLIDYMERNMSKPTARTNSVGDQCEELLDRKRPDYTTILSKLESLYSLSHANIEGVMNLIRVLNVEDESPEQSLGAAGLEEQAETHHLCDEATESSDTNLESRTVKDENQAIDTADTTLNTDVAATGAAREKDSSLAQESLAARMTVDKVDTSTEDPSFSDLTGRTGTEDDLSLARLDSRTRE